MEGYPNPLNCTQFLSLRGGAEKHSSQSIETDEFSDSTGPTAPGRWRRAPVAGEELGRGRGAEVLPDLVLVARSKRSSKDLCLAWIDLRNMVWAYLGPV